MSQPMKVERIPTEFLNPDASCDLCALLPAEYYTPITETAELGGFLLICDRCLKDCTFEIVPAGVC